MSSNFSNSDRPLYDEEVYNQKTNESNKPLKYILNSGAHESCTVCGDKPNVTNHQDRVDLESDLLGHTRKLSRDQSKKYQKNDTIANTLNYSPPFLCERNLKNDKFFSINNKNTYMEKLRNQSPEEMVVISDTTKDMCKIKDYLSKN